MEDKENHDKSHTDIAKDDSNVKMPHDDLQCDSCGNRECSASKRQNGESDEAFRDRQKLQSRLCRMKHKVVVLSGKGGVGKSTVAVNLAMSLTAAGKKTGLLDIDIHGPSIPTMLGIENVTVPARKGEMVPLSVGKLKVMSIGFFLNTPDDAVIWRGPIKYKVIQQFIKDVDWGDLDFLIVDCPPGTGDEPLTICQLIGNLDGAVLVTTPQKVAAVDIRKSVSFCRVLKVPVLGVVENMSGFACPKCGAVTQIMRSGGGMAISRDMGVPFLGSIPIDPQVAEDCDSGYVFVLNRQSSPTAKIMAEITQPILALDSTDAQVGTK